MCVYIYIYTHILANTVFFTLHWTANLDLPCIYNPHLGLINVPPPLILFLPNNDLVHYEFTIKKARHLLISGKHFINTFCDT